MYRRPLAARIPWFLLPLIIAVSGCTNVVVDGDTKINTTPLWLVVLIVAVSIAGTYVCWRCRNESWVTWAGLVGLPAFAVYSIIGYSQLKGIVDDEHFELQSIGNKYSVSFDELSRMEVVEEHTGVYYRGTENVNYYVDLHKKNGETQRITLGDTMKPLWQDIVTNAKEHGVVYHDNYGYFENPR